MTGQGSVVPKGVLRGDSQRQGGGGGHGWGSLGSPGERVGERQLDSSLQLLRSHN